MIKYLLCAVFFLLSFHNGAGQPAAAIPGIDSQVVFLYYRDVDRAARFYEGILGLKKTFDQGWVKIYQLSPGAEVGIVDGKRGQHRVSEQKPVMLSIVTHQIEAWSRYLKSSGVRFVSELGGSRKSPTRGFIVLDPGGYTVEFFQWNEPGSSRQ